MTPISTSTNNSTSSNLRSLKRGVYVPVMTFFKDDEEQSLDLDTFINHIKFVASSGVSGIVVLGSTGEAVSLTDEERNLLIRTGRQTLDSSGFSALPLISGAGGHSTSSAIKSIASASENGADYALVLPSSYYPGQLNQRTAIEFFESVAHKSKLPIVIYSYPGVCSGIDLSSETISELSHHPNIRGVKHTDHSVAKISRESALRPHDVSGSEFFILAGASDYLLGALSCGAMGTITGMGNLAPKSVVKLCELFEDGAFDKAKALQQTIALAEWELGKTGVPGHKSLLNSLRGYGGRPRAPLPATGEREGVEAKKRFEKLMEVEATL